MVEAVVEYDYTAQEPDELTIRKGDVIREIIKKPGGWWEGTLRDKRGMFPDNFVSVIQKEKVSLRQKPNRVRQCRAIFSYHPAHDDELSLGVGDIIDIICEVEEGWWKGKLGNHEGVFPSNFVVEVDASKSQSKNNSKEDLTSLAGEIEMNIPNLPPKPTKIVCQVKYPYDACNDDELSLREGEHITLISKDGQDRGWWRGELRGRIGLFPDNFVVVLPATSVDQNGPQTQSTYSKQDKTDQKSLSKSPLSLQNKSVDEMSPKPANVASQRRSLELKTDDHKAPPLPGKKPNVPKKSPSSAGSSGVLAGMKQKIVDKVDGAASSRAANSSPQLKQDDEDCDFDQVERSAMLPDMRANRVKAPGRRLPKAVYRDSDLSLVNGNSDYAQTASLSETSNDEEENEKKPKAREWEKHKAPWVEELKLNQAKRTSTPVANENTRLRLTPTDKSISPSSEADAKSPAPDKESSSPVDMTKSLSALNTKLKTPTNDILSTSPINIPLRVKPTNQPITTTPVRPQSIHGVMVTSLSTTPPTNQSPSPASKPPVAEKVNIDAKITASGSRSSLEKKVEVVTVKQYMELQEKIAQMEMKMNLQVTEMQSMIDDLKGKLQVESDMRRLLQAELEKVAQCVTQV